MDLSHSEGPGPAEDLTWPEMLPALETGMCPWLSVDSPGGAQQSRLPTGMWVTVLLTYRSLLCGKACSKMQSGDGLKTHSCVSLRRKALGFFAKVEPMLYDFYEQQLREVSKIFACSEPVGKAEE